jgi:hypothetical protein
MDFRSLKMKARHRLKRISEFQMVFSWGVAFFLGTAIGLPAAHILKPITAILALLCLWVTYKCGNHIGALKRTLHELKYSRQDGFWQYELQQLHHLAHRQLISILWL